MAIDPQGTIKERLTRLETLLSNHLHSCDVRNTWLLRILAGAVVGIILLALPGCIQLLGVAFAG